MKLSVERKWVLEVGILIFTFILFALNDWILIKSMTSFSLGIAYYLVLYAHAQLNRYIALPFLIKKQNVSMYIALTILGLIIFSFILSQMTHLFLYRTCFLSNNPAKLSFHYQLGILLGSYFCITGLSLFVSYYHKQRIEADKEILSRKMQVDLLSKQLNPHFLFNTLNTIYGLSIEHPERTPDAVIKVSELLRYQVENSKKDLVSLSEEIAFIDSYIAIEKERFGHRCTIDFDVFIDNIKQYYVAPMIILHLLKTHLNMEPETLKVVL
ncbi:histidine kinase [Flavobacterium agricola]|uniref:Histidine kinase n=1 Tax=Flavobacterium agricola TaxID=2870839 RepID=A0ABY6M1N7_9FLAO|nr:sensor histidine kinase [Flavobacterium agricola]UYW02479.1 histidine kinase [Flavobacterium agricola]